MKIKFNLIHYINNIQNEYRKVTNTVSIGDIVEIKYRIDTNTDQSYTILGVCKKKTKRNLDSTITILGTVDNEEILITFPLFSSTIIFIKKITK